MEYVIITDGLISDIISTSESLKLTGEWRKIDGETFEGHVGMPAGFIDWKTGCMKPIETLVKEGLMVDDRGTYWDTNTGGKVVISEYDIKAGDHLTKAEPPESPYAYWNKKTDSWLVDTAAEEEAKQQALRHQRKYEFETFDKYQTVLVGVLTAEQKKEFDAWRKAWLDAPKTGIAPARPGWFKEY